MSTIHEYCLDFSAHERKPDASMASMLMLGADPAEAHAFQSVLGTTKTTVNGMGDSTPARYAKQTR